MSGIRFLVPLLLAALTAGPASSLAQGDLPQALLADARDGSLDQFDLPAAAIVAAGVSDSAELAACRQQLTEALARVDVRSLRRLPTGERAERLLSALHREVLLGRYDRDASDLRHTLATGDFNCLSALVLYVELCRRAGVDLEIWSLPGHVFCRLAGQPDVRIEPTHRAGSKPAAKVASDAIPRQISPTELIGRFYYNRGVEQLASRQFSGGVELLRVACQLDPADRDARSNLLAGLNNWALALAHADEPAAAARLIEIGLALDPHFPPLKANAEYVRRRAIER